MMLDDNSAILRGVVWTEIFPWLRIFRTFRIAVGVRALVPAIAGMVLMFAGWGVIGRALGPDESGSVQARPMNAYGWALDSAVRDAPVHPTSELWTTQLRPFTGAPISSIAPIGSVWTMLTVPLIDSLDPVAGTGGLTAAALTGLWALAVWALFGGAIVRMATVQLATGDRVGLAAAMRFAAKKWLSFVIAPLLPVLGIVLCAIPIAILGLLTGADVGAVVAAVLWPLALIAGLLMALLALGLIFGWPLMAATIATEGTDAFDALSRSYAYVFQRPLHYLFYAVVAGLLGAAGWLLVSNFAAGVLQLSAWGASWGATDQRMALLAGQPEGFGEIAGISASLFWFWTMCVKLVAVGFLFAFFWSVVPSWYLLLRRDVDATEMDEVYLDADATEPAYGLPPVGQDEAGAPKVEDQPADQEPAE